jgi:hypothetical protein
MMRPAASTYGVTVPLDAPEAPRLGYSLAGFVERQILSWTRPKLVPVTATDGDLGCLTAAVYYEARSEAEDGQRAVAQVVLNRVNRPSFARSVWGRASACRRPMPVRFHLRRIGTPPSRAAGVGDRDADRTGGLEWLGL